MSNARTPLDDLQLQGSPNLRRALQREEAEENAPPLTAAQQSELDELTQLISLAIKACRRGSTVKGRRNPAFANLASLIKSRDVLTRGRKPGKKSTQQLLADADKLLATPTGAN